MKVIDLHPEDLLDKDAKGAITDDERTRLEAHVARCAACRFEREVRADFREEMDDDVAVSSQRLLALVEALPRAANDDTSPSVSPSPSPSPSPTPDATPTKTPSSRPARVRRRNTRVVLLVAAALFIGGVATAGAGARVWAHVAATWASPDPTPTPAVAASAATATTGGPAHARPKPVEPPSEIEPASASASASASALLPPPDARLALPPVVAHAPVHARAYPSSTSSVFAEPAETAATMFDTANEARRKGDYARAIFLHRRLQVTFPSSREAHVSYGTLGRLLLDRGDATAALASFDSYEARGHGPVDEAVLVGRATALERLGRTDEARSAWSALLVAFPDTPYAEHARSHARTASPP